MAGDEAETSAKNTIDINSPYYLTPSDHPGQNFVGEYLLHDGNYTDWKNEIMNALFAKNKIGFVDGTIPKLAEGSTKLNNWQRCNAMVRGWLTSTMTKEIRSSVKYGTTARDIWVDLDERFNKDNAPRVYELRRKITTIHQDNMSLSAYYTKMRGIWDEIQSVSPLPTYRLYDFLMGLNEEFNVVRTQILSSDPIPSVGASFHIVSQDEHQRSFGNSRMHNTDAAAFQVSGRNPRMTEDRTIRIGVKEMSVPKLKKKIVLIVKRMDTLLMVVLNHLIP
ncbi:uncharacterized protein [Rutidosis leptorrhynchoides]|uniref:uncharacterized protein n=1 Tax=Rutidosis leptorrhynchoides TaxID=125765 RepID=UPI003A99BFAF